MTIRSALLRATAAAAALATTSVACRAFDSESSPDASAADAAAPSDDGGADGAPPAVADADADVAPPAVDAGTPCNSGGTFCESFDVDDAPSTRGWQNRIWGADSSAAVVPNGRSAPGALLSSMGTTPPEGCRMAQLFYESQPGKSRVIGTVAVKRVVGDAEFVLQLTLGDTCKVALAPAVDPANSRVEVEGTGSNARHSLGSVPMNTWTTFRIDMNAATKKLVVDVDARRALDVSLPASCGLSAATLYVGAHCVDPGREISFLYDDIVVETP